MKINANYRLSAAVKQLDKNKKFIKVINEVFGTHFDYRNYEFDGGFSEPDVQRETVEDKSPKKCHKLLLKIADKFDAYIDDGYYDVDYKFSERISIDYWTYIFSFKKIKSFSNSAPATENTVILLEIYYTGCTVEEVLNGEC